MTNKQPYALWLADEAWDFDCSEYLGVSSANAAMMGKLQDCADMIRKLHAENEALHAERERNLHSIRVNNEIINKKLDENETLRTGYAAARLEIESLLARGAPPDVSGYVSEWSGGLCTSDEAMDGIARLYAAQPVGAQQPGAAYAALPEPDLVSKQRDSTMRYTTVRSFSESQMRAFADATCAIRAPHGQAPAQAAPAAVAGPSDAETVDVVGVRANGAHVNLGKVAMPPRMKAREIAVEQFGGFENDDGSDAELCFWAMESFLDWLVAQGWTAAPTTQPAPQQEPTCKENLQVQVWVIPNGAGGGQISWQPQDERYWTKLTAHPASQQEAQSALFDKQGFRAWVLHNLPDDTIIGSSAYWADHLSAWAQRFVKKAPQQEATDALARAEYYIDNPSAWSSFDQRISDDISAVTEALRAALAAPKPQQEAQEPVAWYVTGCGRLLDEYEAEAEARRIGGTAKAMPLYTAPPPSPASQGDALDAAQEDK